MTFRTDDELDAALTELAAAAGRSRQEIIRRAVLDRYERAGHTSRVNQSAGLVFLDLHGREVELTDASAFALDTDVAGGLDDVDQIAQRLGVLART